MSTYANRYSTGTAKDEQTLLENDYIAFAKGTLDSVTLHLERVKGVLITQYPDRAYYTEVQVIGRKSVYSVPGFRLSDGVLLDPTNTYRYITDEKLPLGIREAILFLICVGTARRTGNYTNLNIP